MKFFSFQYKLLLAGDSSYLRENFLVRMSSTAEFNSQFEAFAKFGDKKSSGKDISLTQSDKWLKQAKVLGEGEAIPIADAAIYFKAMKQPRLSLAQYLKFLEQLTSRKEGLLDDVKNKMTTCGAPVVRKMKKVFTNRECFGII